MEDIWEGYNSSMYIRLLTFFSSIHNHVISFEEIVEEVGYRYKM